MIIDTWKLDNVQISEEHSTNSLPTCYLQGRELLWIAKKNELGDRLWNGIVYTIEQIGSVDGKLSLDLGRCEYKDILFKEAIGVQELLDTYGKNCLLQHLIVCVIPITTDELLILSEVGGGTSQQRGLVDLIGGTANRDEVNALCFDDLSQFAFRELKEEIGLGAEDGCLRPWVLVGYSGRFALLYTFHLYVSSQDLKYTLNEEEVASLVFVTREALLKNTNREHSLEIRVLRELLGDSGYDLKYTSV